MANRAHSSSMPDVRSQFIWPRRNPNIRRLKQGEIERLKEALSEEADREYLVFWVSQSIANHVKLTTSRPPTARQCRDGLRRLAGQGRRWLQQIDACPGTDLLGPGVHVAEVTTKVVELCQQAEAVAKAVGGSALFGVLGGIPARLAMPIMLSRNASNGTDVFGCPRLIGGETRILRPRGQGAGSAPQLHRQRAKLKAPSSRTQRRPLPKVVRRRPRERDRSQAYRNR